MGTRAGKRGEIGPQVLEPRAGGRTPTWDVGWELKCGRDSVVKEITGVHPGLQERRHEQTVALEQ